MPQKVYHVQLNRRDRQQLENYVTHGQRAARAVTRARILLLADEYYGDEEIMEVLGVSRPTVAKMRRKYQEHKDGAVVELLQEAARPGQQNRRPERRDPTADRPQPPCGGRPEKTRRAHPLDRLRRG